MGLSIKNAAVETLARDLAKRNGTGVTDIIHQALKEKADRDDAEPSLWEKTAPIRERLEKAGRTGLVADKAFYNMLSGEE